MGMKNGRTICSKHDEIKLLSERLENLLSRQTSIDSFSDTEVETLEDTIENCPVLLKFLSLLKEDAGAIYHLADNAKDDGQAMENGLNEKKDRIDKLLEDIEDIEDYQKSDLEYQEKIAELEGSLETANSRITYLSSLLENNHV